MRCSPALQGLFGEAASLMSNVVVGPFFPRPHINGARALVVRAVALGLAGDRYAAGEGGV